MNSNLCMRPKPPQKSRYGTYNPKGASMIHKIANFMESTHPNQQEHEEQASKPRAKRFKTKDSNLRTYKGLGGV